MLLGSINVNGVKANATDTAFTIHIIFVYRVQLFLY